MCRWKTLAPCSQHLEGNSASTINEAMHVGWEGHDLWCSWAWAIHVQSCTVTFLGRILHNVCDKLPDFVPSDSSRWFVIARCTWGRNLFCKDIGRSESRAESCNSCISVTLVNKETLAVVRHVSFSYQWLNFQFQRSLFLRQTSRLVLDNIWQIIYPSVCKIF